MKYLTFDDDSSNLQYAILIRQSSLKKQEVERHYIEPLEKLGFNRNEFVFIGIPCATKKFTAQAAKDQLYIVAKGLKNLDIKNVLVANTELFKFITKNPQISKLYGEIVQGKLEGFEEIEVILSIDYYALYFQNGLQTKLDISLQTLYNKIYDVFSFNKDIIHSGEYTDDTKILHSYLYKYLDEEKVSVDIETTTLYFTTLEIATIGFALDKHNGFVFIFTEQNRKRAYYLLRHWFTQYSGKLLTWNASFDIKILIYHIYMVHPEDWEGLSKGLLSFTNVEDVMLKAYLCVNSTQENPLDLKNNSIEFAGNYSEDVEDISKIPIMDLCVYNLKDCLCTQYTEEKFQAKLVEEEQEEVYETIFKASLRFTIPMMIIGLPLDMDEVLYQLKTLTKTQKQALNSLRRLAKVKQCAKELTEIKLIKENEKLKVKVKTLNDIEPVVFNPNSPNHLRHLFYNVFEQPVVFTTKKGHPSTDRKAIKAIRKLSENNLELDKVVDYLEILSDLSALLSTFLPSFVRLGYYRNGTQCYYLNGNLRLGGTQGGRLSSSDPNLQNQPSNSKYGKVIKKIFKAPKGYLIGGADYSSLEDRINAILTNDPNKIKVYTDGYDGHCLRAYSYFGDKMENIDPDDVNSINSIETLYPDLRQESKSPTFALTYLGTYKTLVTNIGMTEAQARSVEANYHELYKVSDEFSDAQIDFAYKNGYVECAFGLKLRTPFMYNSVRTKRSSFHVAQEEERSAVNAVTQSWGMLMNRALIAIMDLLVFNRQKDSDPVLGDILPANTIHDAGYFLFRDDPKIIKWLNEHLIKEMEWNDNDKIRSSEVPMQAQMTIGNDLSNQFALSKGADIEEINLVRSKIHANTINK